jgi:hypothetical protein
MNKLILAFVPLVLFGCSYSTTADLLYAEDGLVVETPSVTVEQISVVDERRPDLDLFLGQTPVKVLSQLTQPSLVRRDGNVQTFQFVNKFCILDVYFYREDNNEDFIATNVAARGFQGEQLSKENCFLSFYEDGKYPEELLPSIMSAGE